MRAKVCHSGISLWCRIRTVSHKINLHLPRKVVGRLLVRGAAPRANG